MRSKKIVAGALAGLLNLAATGQGQEAPNPLPVPSLGAPARPAASFNQRMATSIAGYLEASGRFKGQPVEVAFYNGLAELSGNVSSLTQKAEAVRIARMIPGVVAVRDNIMVPGVTPAPMPMPQPMPAPAPQSGILPAQAVVPAQGIAPAPGVVPPTGLPEPLSIMPTPTMPNPMYQPPPMPPYAWPTYAPYNNLSRVAYPNLYPYEAWPFIGPMYPFPKVPPGWRAVTLRWQDGHWWYGRSATGHDWWRIRYW